MMVWALSTRVIQLTTGLVSNLVLAWFLDPEDFGRFALIGAPLTICYTWISLRLSAQILACPEAKFSQTLFLNAMIQEGIFCSLIFLIVLGSIRLVSWFSFFVILDTTLGYVLNNLKAFHERAMSYKNLAREEMIGQFGSTCIILTLTYFYPHPLALCLKGLIASIYLIIKLLPPFSFRWLSFQNWIEIARGCKSFWVDAAMETSLVSFLQLAAGFAGEKMAGFFFQAHRISVAPAQWFSPTLNRYALNLFRRTENRAEKKKKLKEFLFFILFPLLGVTFFFGIWSQEIILFCFGPQWIEAAPFLTHLCGLSLLITVFHLIKMYFLHENRFKTLFYARAFQFFPLVIFSIVVQDIGWLTLALPISYLIGVSIGIFRLTGTVQSA